MEKINTTVVAEITKQNLTKTQTLAQGVPVLVNPVIRQNTEAKTDLGLHMKIGPDKVHIAQIKS